MYHTELFDYLLHIWIFKISYSSCLSLSHLSHFSYYINTTVA